MRTSSTKTRRDQKPSCASACSNSCFGFPGAREHSGLQPETRRLQSCKVGYSRMDGFYDGLRRNRWRSAVDHSIHCGSCSQWTGHDHGRGGARTSQSWLQRDEPMEAQKLRFAVWLIRLRHKLGESWETCQSGSGCPQSFSTCPSQTRSLPSVQ